MTQPKSAEELFSDGLTCSQAILSAYAERYGLDLDLARSIAAGFSAGMQRAETCGAAAGAIMVLGLHACSGSCETKEQRAKVSSLTKLFLDQFKNQNDSTVCSELLGCDITTEDGLKIARENKLFETKCRKFVKNSREILETLLR